jgi:hypothetical protein
VFTFKLTANQCIVAQASDFVRIGDRVDVHAIVWQRFLDISLKSMPKQSARTN